MSGGADSLALLVLAVEAGLDVTAIHVDHGTREGSAAEAEVVAAAARRFGARFESRAVQVETGPNLEARWRAARQSVLPPDAMTGHTLDDQAETILLNLLRGSASDGLAGIRPGPTKPLLQIRRRETRALCDASDLVPVEDPSNVDPAFRRARIRREALPLLDAIAQRDVAALLARQADVIREDVTLLDRIAEERIPDPTDARALNDAPRALARRAVRRWLTGPTGHPLDLASIDRVLAVARCEVEACELPGGVRVERSGMRLRATPT
ncbi:MAG TPA: tRNA lysidine(34) synthetase TilS [Acidimicrobiales bacterium]|nr:tRNA lysidine(34) synthetase TilS [Acidimicrobiales bacterium]